MTLAQWRSTLGMTQRELAESLGVGTSTLARWERGATEPRWLKLLILFSRINREELP